MSELNILQRMSLATDKIERVKKNLNVGAGTKSEYKAVSEADVLAAVKPVEFECGIYSYPVSSTVLESGRYTTISEWNGKQTEKENFMLRIERRYRFCNIDKPDDFIEITSYGDGWDAQDKAPGKAMTYADKYALLKAYKIETGDDPDKDPSGTVKPKTNEKTPAPQQTAGPEPAEESPAKQIMKAVNAKWKDNKLAAAPILKILKQYGYESTKEVTFEYLAEILVSIKEYEV